MPILPRRVHLHVCLHCQVNLRPRVPGIGIWKRYLRIKTPGCLTTLTLQLHARLQSHQMATF